MRVARLRRALAKASLIAAPACCWMGDDHVSTTRVAPRAIYAEPIDACLAGTETACYELCNALVDREDYEGTEWSGLDECGILASNPDRALVHFEYTLICTAGRRPRGLVATPCADSAAAWLASAATVEAASVTAFRRLVASLIRLGAPRPTIARARRAITDELRHAEVVGRLARHRGAHVEAAVVLDAPEPTVEQLAHDNAVEGQVAETLGALIATCQARTATDPEVRAAYAMIARDEARHAALAYELGAWLDGLLDDRARARVARARRRAIQVMPGQVTGDLPRADRALLGIPAPAPLRAAATAAFAELG